MYVKYIWRFRGLENYFKVGQFAWAVCKIRSSRNNPLNPLHSGELDLGIGGGSWKGCLVWRFANPTTGPRHCKCRGAGGFENPHSSIYKVR